MGKTNRFNRIPLGLTLALGAVTASLVSVSAGAQSPKPTQAMSSILSRSYTPRYPLPTNGGMYRDIETLAYDLVSGRIENGTVTPWLQQVFGYADPPNLLIRISPELREQGASNELRGLEDFYDHPNVETEWSSRTAIAPGTLVIYLMAQPPETASSLPASVERSCERRACAIVFVDMSSAHAVEIALGQIQEVTRRFTPTATAPLNIQPDDAPASPQVVQNWAAANFMSMTDAVSVFRALNPNNGRDACGTLLWVDSSTMPRSARYLCIVRVGAESRSPIQ